MPTAIVPLANITLSGTSTGLTFSNINQGYRDLMLVVTGTISSGTGSFYLTFNSDGSTQCYNITLEANGSSAVSTSQGAWTGMWGPYSYNTCFSTAISTHTIHLTDYSANDKHKNVLMRSSNASTMTGAVLGRWSSTVPINSFSFIPTASTFAAGTTFELFGVKA